ncbi:MAG: hypothetical protein EPN40_01390, partial [Rhodanobacteraceae bacterium]
MHWPTGAARPASATSMNVRGPHRVDIPGYRLVRWIGASGAASLYMAAERSNEEPAAVKIFHRVDTEVLARLERQLQENARLAHPNIVPVLAIGHTNDGRLFYAMPLLLGFEQARGGLSGSSLRIAMLLRDLLAGLGYAHQCAVTHGGIKPSNVLFDERGLAQLADFGLAHCMAGSGQPRSGMALQQADGAPPNPSSDLHGIGMLACELLAGTRAIRHRDAIAAPSSQARQLAPRLPPGLARWQAWIDRALAESPEQRFHDAKEMSDALGAISGGGYRGRGHPVGLRPRRLAPRLKLQTVMLFAAIVAFAGWVMWGYQGEPDLESDSVPAAASVASPALPTTVALPAPGLPATADAASPLTDRVVDLITTGDALRANGHLFSPPFHNAASGYLAALDLDPGNPAAIAGIDAMLAALRDRLDRTWQDGRSTSEAASLLQQGDALAEHADAHGRRAWRNHRRRLAQRVGSAVVRAARAHDSLKISALEPLAEALPAKFPAGFDLASAESATNTPVPSALPKNTPGAGERMRDPRGPLLVYVPASGKLPAFAIARVEVTRADYAEFAAATHRSAAECLAAHNPFSRLRHLSWRAPGFTQGADHPVVCVSWDDAVAYAAWLSQTTGQTYTLPSGNQWLRAAQGVPKGDACQLGNVDDASRRSRLDDDRWSCSD